MTDLKIEAGKCYRTRSGEKATVMFMHPSNPTHPCVGFIEDAVGVHVWTASGTIFRTGALSGNDLISEWKEPRKGEVWVGVFENSRGEISTRTFDPDNAIQATAGILDRIACVGPIPWTEGQGLDGEGGE